MKHRVKLSQTAKADLLQIRNWIAQEADPETANRYIDRITTKFLQLETFPNRGTPRPEINPGFRSLSFERTIVIFYRIVEKEVWIERFIHGRMIAEEAN